MRQLTFTLESLESRTLLAASDYDLAFGSSGVATLSFGGTPIIVRDTAVQPDGKILIAGSKGTQAAVGRLNVNGSTDLTFGNNGLVERDEIDFASAVALQEDGKILIAGREDADSVAVMRLDSNGVLDETFRGGPIDMPGLSGLNIGDEAVIRDMMVQRDGNILVVGDSRVGGIFNPDFDMFITRLLPTGRSDTSFDVNGTKEIDFGGADRAYAVTVDYNNDPFTNPRYGTIVIAGSREFEGARMALVRLLPNGDFDNSFEDNGRLTAVLPATHTYARDVVIQPGGKVVVAGGFGSPFASPPHLNFIAARFTAAGLLDSTFNSSGYTVLDFGGVDEAWALEIGYQGDLVLSGNSNYQLALAMLTANGTPQTRFSDDGMRVYGGTTLGDAMLVTRSQASPIRRIIVPMGSQKILRVEDNGPSVTLTSLDSEAAEAGMDVARFRVTRDSNANTDRIFFDVTGTARRPGITAPVGFADYFGTNIEFEDPTVGRVPYVTMPAGVSSVDITLTPYDDTRVEGDESAVFTIAANNAYAAGTPASFSMIVRDNDVATGPVVNTSSYQFETMRRLSFTFSQNVSASITAGDIVLTGPAGVPAGTFAYDAVNNTATLTYASPLPDGNYAATINAGSVTNATGQPLPTNHVLPFFVLAGDANRDRVVDVADLGILAANFRQPDRTYSRGDFNVDGTVDVADLGILAAAFRRALPLPAMTLGLRPNVITHPTEPPSVLDSRPNVVL